MALDNGYPFAGQSLPTPSDTPYQTPSRGLSGRSSRLASSSPYSNYSPAPFPPEGDSYFPADDAGDERYSVRDPRRLTQNLDMSLVTQIHSLKKELESRDTLVHTLEESLHQTRSENERLTDDATTQKAEVRSVKLKMQSLERDMLQEFENTVRERDNAIDSVADTRKRLEESKKKIRTQEEDADRSHALWEKDRQDLEDKYRKLEGKNHVLEEHLRTMAAAIDAQNIAHNQPGADVSSDNFGPRTGSRQSNRSLDDIYEDKEATHFRDSTRDSRMNGQRKLGGSQMGGMSLAEELAFGDDDDDGDDEDDDYHRAMRSPNALPEENQPIRRYSEDEKARKVMGLHDRSSSQASVITKDIHAILPRKQSAVSYTDTAMQCSPPPSPLPYMRQCETLSEKSVEQTEHAANQSRKRVAIPNIFIEQTSTAKLDAPKAEATKASRMVSSGCQTVAKTTANVHEALVFALAAVKETASSSTQTSDDGLAKSNSASNRLSPPSMDVPVIAIHPPASRPGSSHTGVVLPPRTKNAGCQVVIEMPRSQISTSVQTEVQNEKRSVRLPPKLHFSNPLAQASSQYNERRTQAPESSQDSTIEASKRIVPVAPPKSSKRAVPSPPIETNGIRDRPASPRFENAYPGNNDNGPLTSKDRFGPRRPIRSESIFAGFDTTDDGNDKVPSDFSDDSFVNAAPIRKTLSKVQNSWKLVPQSDDALLDRLGSTTADDKGEQQSKDSNKNPDQPATSKVPSQTTSKTFQTKASENHRKPSSTTKEADVRHQALVSNGIAEHAQHARSPSAPNAPDKEVATIAPPFPVPTRSSSRRIPVSASDGAVSPSPYTTSFFSVRRSQDPGRAPAKRKILRKTQSAAAVAKPNAPAYPPPPLPNSSSSSMPGRPKSPRVHPNQFVLPYDDVAELPNQLPRVTRPKSHAGEATIEAPSQQTSVVDAIAQTMVGEWMWKYVRKRTSFGVTETPAAEFESVRSGEAGNSSGVRHKRWVWLAPYENAVIWSSKQPTSGPALLGKGGRKLTIQSVLDVKDDMPLPKNAGSQSAFDRSILILTPERALKFTATSRDRHYIWLTALSFLSHSTQGMIELNSPPPMPKQEYQAPTSQRPPSGFRRTPIRDSIRVAKDKPRPYVGSQSYSSPTGEIGPGGPTIGWGDSGHLSEDAAEPPQVPRIAAHARKRSSTGPRPVPLSAFHNYPGNSISLGSSFSSSQAATSRDKYNRYVPRSHGLGGDVSYDMTPYIESYTPPLPVVPANFYDHVGTMRMEAFVEKDESRYAEPSKGKREARSYRTKQGKKKEISNYWSVAASGGSNGAPSLHLRSDDPFTGF